MVRPGGLLALLVLAVPASARGFDAHRRNLTGRTTDAYLGFRLGGLPGVAFGVVTPIVLIVRALGSGPDVVAP